VCVCVRSVQNLKLPFMVVSVKLLHKHASFRPVLLVDSMSWWPNCFGRRRKPHLLSHPLLKLNVVDMWFVPARKLKSRFSSYGSSKRQLAHRYCFRSRLRLNKSSFWHRHRLSVQCMHINDMLLVEPQDLSYNMISGTYSIGHKHS